MDLKESKKIFERYFNGPIISTELATNNTNIKLTIGDHFISIYPSFIYIKNEGCILIPGSDIFRTNSEEDLMTYAAIELKNILDGNPSKQNRYDLAANNIRRMCIESNLEPDSTRCDFDGGKILIDIMKGTKDIDFTKLREFKSTYRSNIFYDRIDLDNYLFSIKIKVV